MRKFRWQPSRKWRHILRFQSFKKNSNFDWNDFKFGTVVDRVLNFNIELYRKVLFVNFAAVGFQNPHPIAEMIEMAPYFPFSILKKKIEIIIEIHWNFVARLTRS